jgi:hypothetical protein
MGCSNSTPSKGNLNPLIKESLETVQEKQDVKQEDETLNIDITNLDYENMTEEEIMAIEMGNLSFFKKISAVDTTRDYTIIVDSSGLKFY